MRIVILPVSGLLLLAVMAGLPAIARGADLKEKLKAYRLTPMDMPPGWKLIEKPSVDPQFDSLVKSMREYQEKSGYLFEILGVNSGTADFLVLPFVFEKPHTKKWLEETFKKNAGNFHLVHFRIGDAVIVVNKEDEDTVRALKSVLGRKITMDGLERARALLLDHKEDEADRVLEETIDGVPECAAAHAWVAEMYAESFSHPRPNRALKLFNRAIEIHKKMPDLPHVLWTAGMGAGKLYEEKEDPQGALSSYRLASDAGSKGSPRLKAKALLESGRIQASQGDKGSAIGSLAEALGIEIRFGSKEVAGKIGNEKSFAGLLEDEKLKSLLEKCEAKAPPQVFTDPLVKKLNLGKIKVLVLPPVIRGSEGRREELEAFLEKELMKKFRRNGACFGDKRQALADGGEGGFGEILCLHARDAVLQEGGFDLYRTKGNRHRLHARIRRVREIAVDQSLADFYPSYILALSIELSAGGEPAGKPVAKVVAVLCRPQTSMITALYRLEVEAPEEKLKATLRFLGGDVHRKIGSAVRSGKWK